MAFKRIYIAKRNHIVFASGSTVSEIHQHLLKGLIHGEGIEIPSFSTFIRRLRLYSEIKFSTTKNNSYEIIEMKNTRYNRSRMA